MKTSTRAPVAFGVLALVLMSACSASVPPRAPSPRPSGAALNGVRHVLVVTTGESRFAVAPSTPETDETFEQVMKWLPYQGILAPIARAVRLGIAHLVDADRRSTTLPKDVSPVAVVAQAFARTLQESGPFATIVPLDREPVGDTRRDADAIVRLSVPSWGLMRVRQDRDDQIAAFADVRARMVLRETGITVWEHEEDVTHPERLAIDAFTRDRALTRQELVDVLERAGRRLGNELLYAWNTGR